MSLPQKPTRPPINLDDDDADEILHAGGSVVVEGVAAAFYDIALLRRRIEVLEQAADKRPDATVACLNRALTVSPEAIQALFAYRVPCTTALRDDPHIIVGGEEAQPDVGLLGILNGVLAANGLPQVMSKCGERSGTLFSFAPREHHPAKETPPQ